MDSLTDDKEAAVRTLRSLSVPPVLSKNTQISRSLCVFFGNSPKVGPRPALDDAMKAAALTPEPAFVEDACSSFAFCADYTGMLCAGSAQTARDKGHPYSPSQRFSP